MSQNIAISLSCSPNKHIIIYHGKLEKFVLIFYITTLCLPPHLPVMIVWHRYTVPLLILSSVLYLGGCDHSFVPHIDETISEEVAFERVQRVKEFYQAALEKEQSTLASGAFKILDDSSHVSEALSDSMVVVALEEMVNQYPPDWDNAETWIRVQAIFSPHYSDQM